ncbi:group III truncated hemoglobin [Zavarzinia compransoris]|uniref:Preprotein translocase subunit TatC n=1 Tax=Zavarzinia compransoris TaxID=1264899 RepID=A0A317E655_9PROT|nr:group III truncated hemoglobin [Zavarzinia compransoris]PWR22131.1 preprotein translocase subunit TatC [Zavarzinia compransoris]TDP47120.1 hemoglobin [Zavarzinia compransoris]
MDAGIDDEGLRRLVAAFYARVRLDAELGPIFNGAIADWPAHLATLGDFWSSVMHAGGRYRGNPLAAHLKHAATITPAHFERWLALWQATAEEVAPEAAGALQAKARRIAESLQLALFYRPA